MSKCLVYNFKDFSKKLQRASFLCWELMEDGTETSLNSDICKKRYPHGEGKGTAVAHENS